MKHLGINADFADDNADTEMGIVFYLLIIQLTVKWKDTPIKSTIIYHVKIPISPKTQFTSHISQKSVEILKKYAHKIVSILYLPIIWKSYVS